LATCAENRMAGLVLIHYMMTIAMKVTADLFSDV
jgi:hypothetical protein